MVKSLNIDTHQTAKYGVINKKRLQSLNYHVLVILSIINVNVTKIYLSTG